MSRDEQALHEVPLPWRVFGPEKDAWKMEGNYFTADELRQLEVDASELRLTACPEIPLSAD